RVVEVLLLTLADEVRHLPGDAPIVTVSSPSNYLSHSWSQMIARAWIVARVRCVAGGGVLHLRIMLDLGTASHKGRPRSKGRGCKCGRALDERQALGCSQGRGAAVRRDNTKHVRGVLEKRR